MTGAVLDLRDGDVQQEITELQWTCDSDLNLRKGTHGLAHISEYTDPREQGSNLTIDSEDEALALIRCLQKSIDLGWYTS